jgi:hypothetical protein
MKTKKIEDTAGVFVLKCKTRGYYVGSRWQDNVPIFNKSKPKAKIFNSFKIATWTADNYKLEIE